MVILSIVVRLVLNVYLLYLALNYFILIISFLLEVNLNIVKRTIRFFLVGNHESITMNQMYGFEGEVKAKYTAQMFQLFTEVFNYLPLAHCINNKVLVCVYFYCSFEEYFSLF
jgi:hypothetical protein